MSLLALGFSCPACYYSKQHQHLSVRVQADSHLALLGHASAVNLLPVKPACQAAAGQPRSPSRPAGWLSGRHRTASDWEAALKVCFLFGRDRWEEPSGGAACLQASRLISLHSVQGSEEESNHGACRLLGGSRGPDEIQ